MEPNPLLGLLSHLTGGFSAATHFVPFRGIKRWSWEIFWLIQAFAAWVVTPIAVTLFLLPNLFSLLRQACAIAPQAVLQAALFGALAGLGTFSFGLAVRFLGLALGYVISLSSFLIFSTFVPNLFSHQLGALFTTTSGMLQLLAALLAFIAVALAAAAGVLKDRELTYDEKSEAGEPDYNFRRGIPLAALAALLGTCLTLGIGFGTPIAALALPSLIAAGHTPIWQTLPILVVVLAGGFLAQLVWGGILIFRNRSAGQFFGTPGVNPMRSTPLTGYTMADFDPEDPMYSERLSLATLLSNYALAVLAGILWFGQFLFYALGQARLGRFGNQSWPLHLASVILFATLWGLFFKEWHNTSPRTRVLVGIGTFLLFVATFVVMYAGSLLRVYPQ